ncbi:MAG: hypothetical protein ABW185_28580, partial [Sedimenticola sp.]
MFSEEDLPPPITTSELSSFDVVQEDDAADPSTPERVPTPEPIHLPAPEPQREPTSDPVRIPTPEPEPAVTVIITTNNISSPSNPRSCHITKYPDFQGYGFNLHTDKNKKGQNIGLVDDGSAAADADLRNSDLKEISVRSEDETKSKIWKIQEYHIANSSASSHKTCNDSVKQKFDDSDSSERSESSQDGTKSKSIKKRKHSVSKGSASYHKTCNDSVKQKFDDSDSSERSESSQDGTKS